MTYASEVLADAPAMYLQMQETSGTVATDSSGNGRNGTYVNGAAVNDTTDPACSSNLGKHIRLDGTDDHVLLDASNWFTPATSGYTFECWVRVRSWVNWVRIFDFSNTTASDISCGRNSVSQTFLFGTPTEADFAAFSAASWHHIVVAVSSAGAFTFYVDGAVLASGSVGAPINQARQFKYLGRSCIGGDPYIAASFTHVAVYHSVLSSTRIAAHYAAGKEPTASQLAGQQLEIAVSGVPDSRLAGQQLETVVSATPSNRLAGQQLEVVVPTYTSTDPADTAYSTAVKADSPLAYWKLADSADSTRVYDSSGNARHGVRVGGNDVWSPADGGKGIEFVGVSGTGIDCGASNVLGTGYANMSTECWTRSTSAASQQIICQARDYSGATGSNNWQMCFHNGKLMCAFYCASAYLEPVTTLTYNDGKWHHLVGVYNGATLKMYVDGVEVFSQALVGGNVNSGGTARLKMGNFGGSTVASGTGTNVAFDEVAIYGTALSATQVANHYAARLASATYAQVSRESLRAAVKSVGAVQVSRESLRVAVGPVPTLSPTGIASKETWPVASATHWYGLGLANGQPLTNTLAGTGDTVFDTIGVGANTSTTNTDVQFTYTTSACYGQWTFTASDYILARFDLVMPTTGMATSLQIFAAVSSTSDHITRLSIAGTGGNLGALRILDSAAATNIESTWRMTPGVRYTLQVRYAKGASTNSVRVNCYTTDGTLFGTVSTTTLVQAPTNQVNRLRFGAYAYATSGQTITLGDFAYASTTGGDPNEEIPLGPLVLLGPITVSLTGIASLAAFGTAAVTAGTPAILPTGIASLEAFGTVAVSVGAPTGGLPKYWNGTTWKLIPAKYWNGTSWVQKPIKSWTGTAWDPV